MPNKVDSEKGKIKNRNQSCVALSVILNFISVNNFQRRGENAYATGSQIKRQTKFQHAFCCLKRPIHRYRTRCETNFSFVNGSSIKRRRKILIFYSLPELTIRIESSNRANYVSIKKPTL